MKNHNLICLPCAVTFMVVEIIILVVSSFLVVGAVGRAETVEKDFE